MLEERWEKIGSTRFKNGCSKRYDDGVTIDTGKTISSVS
jgi:hypothetical protein